MDRFRYCVALILIANTSLAQTTFNGWFASNNLFKINSKLSVHLDVQVRSTDKVEYLSSFLFRPGINFHLRKNIIATAGYGYIHNRRSMNDVAGYVPEQRIWEQLILNHHAHFVSIQQRIRLEQRFIGKFQVVNGDFITGGNRFANRLRYFTRSIVPFNGSRPFAKGVFGAIQNEVFVNVGDKSAVNGKFFDQNRLYLAVGYRLSSKADLEAGYLNQYVSGVNKSLSRAHIVQLAIYLRL